jgi:hypothetical protein
VGELIENILKFTTLGDQIDRAQRGYTTQWLVDGILVQNGLNMIYAPPGVGKSLVALDLVLAASEGRQWLNYYEIQQQPTLYVDEDGNNDHELNARLLAFKASPDDSPADIKFCLHQGFKITNENHRKSLIRYCKDMDIKLVIMDSLTRLHDQSESDANGMKIVTAALKELSLAGLTVVMLHHSTKSGKAARGSSEIESGYDSIIKIERIDKQSFKMLPTKARSVGSSGIWDGCVVQIFNDDDERLMLVASDQNLDDDEEPVVDKQEAKRQRMRDGVLEQLGQHETMTETALGEALGNSGRDKEPFKAVLQELVDEERIMRTKQGKGNYYCLLAEQDDDLDETDEESDDEDD